MLTLETVNRVYAAHSGHVPRHQLASEPRPPVSPSVVRPEASLTEKRVDVVDHQPEG